MAGYIGSKVAVVSSGTDYTATNGNSITLTVGAATDDQVVVVSYNTFQTSDTVSASTGGTFSNAVTIDADGLHLCAFTCDVCIWCDYMA